MTNPYRDQQSPYYSPQRQHWGPQSVYDQQVVYSHCPPTRNQNQNQYPHYPTQQAVPFPTSLHPQPHHGSYTYGQPSHAPYRRPDRGRDYLESLSTSINNLNLGQSHSELARDKPLPRLPPAPITYPAPHPLESRSGSLPSFPAHIPPLPTPPAIPPRPVTQVVRPTTPPGSTISPIKSFTPSFHPDLSGSQEELLRPPHLGRPLPDSSVPSPSRGKGKGKEKSYRTEINLTLDSEDDDSPTKSDHRRRAISDIPRTSKTSTSIATPRTPQRSPAKSRPQPSPSPSSPNAVRCSGYTRAGQPCKRVVKSTAPFLLSRDLNIDPNDADGKEERYCKDHAGRICQVGGFYWRGKHKSVWIEFDDYISDTLGQQTQTLLRTTMESRLTDKDLPGFLYAYELRDLQTSRVSYYKIGRTDNVPRRMSEWSSQCKSHTPTLRDIFPRRSTKPISSRLHTQSDLARRQTGSYLPGAFHSGSNNDQTRPRVAAMKRWERLVHLELADMSSRDCSEEWANVRGKCGDCGSVHREIFPVLRMGDGREYEDIVRIIVERWAGFVDIICSDI